MTDKHSHPFVVETKAAVTARLLFFADTFEEAEELAADRIEELFAALRERGGLDEQNEAILYDAEIRFAHGNECLGTHALTPGLIEFDTCDDADHVHGVADYEDEEDGE